MVKHPRYQAMDNARQNEIPRALDRYCGEVYNWTKVEPQASKGIPGPIPRPSFHVFKGKDRVASFYPNGHSECYDDEFKKIYERIEKDVEKVAQEALKRFEKEYRRD